MCYDPTKIRVPIIEQHGVTSQKLGTLRTLLLTSRQLQLSIRRLEFWKASIQILSQYQISTSVSISRKGYATEGPPSYHLPYISFLVSPRVISLPNKYYVPKKQPYYVQFSITFTLHTCNAYQKPYTERDIGTWTAMLVKIWAHRQDASFFHEGRCLSLDCVKLANQLTKQPGNQFHEAKAFLRR